MLGYCFSPLGRITTELCVGVLSYQGAHLVVVGLLVHDHSCIAFVSFQNYNCGIPTKALEGGQFFFW